MPPYSERIYDGADDLRALVRFAQRCASENRAVTPYYHPGDLVWQLYGLSGSQDVRIWRNGQRVVALGVFEPPLTFQFDVDPDAHELVPQVLSWAEDRRAAFGKAEDVPIAYAMLGDKTISTSVLDSDSDRARWLAASGYASVERGGVRFERSLHEPIPTAPRGATFRHIGEAELTERVDLHRDAWSVWGTSSFDLPAYRMLRDAPLYDPELDVVLEHDGLMVSYCICWTDDVHGVGYFEPVGTRPSFVGRGFGRTVMHEGLRRLRDRGMAVARVGTASVNPGAAALYASAGFSVVDHEHYWVKTLDASL